LKQSVCLAVSDERWQKGVEIPISPIDSPQLMYVSPPKVFVPWLLYGPRCYKQAKRTTAPMSTRMLCPSQRKRYSPLSFCHISITFQVEEAETKKVVYITCLCHIKGSVQLPVHFSHGCCRVQSMGWHSLNISSKVTQNRVTSIIFTSPLIVTDL